MTPQERIEIMKMLNFVLTRSGKTKSGISIWKFIPAESSRRYYDFFRTTYLSGLNTDRLPVEAFEGLTSYQINKKGQYIRVVSSNTSEAVINDFVADLLAHGIKADIDVMVI